jgi:hypothetical protein
MNIRSIDVARRFSCIGIINNLATKDRRSMWKREFR